MYRYAKKKTTKKKCLVHFITKIFLNREEKNKKQKSFPGELSSSNVFGRKKKCINFWGVAIIYNMSWNPKLYGGKSSKRAR